MYGERLEAAVKAVFEANLRSELFMSALDIRGFAKINHAIPKITKSQLTTDSKEYDTTTISTMPAPDSPKRVYHDAKTVDKKMKEEQAKKVHEHNVHNPPAQEHHIKKSTIESDRLGKNLHMS